MSLDGDNAAGRTRATAVAVDLFADIRPGLERVERELHRRLHSDKRFLLELATHLVRGGGKRLRPALVLQSARAFDYCLDRVVPVAAAVEMIHMATLIHDDVIDGSDLRRGLPTVNAKWGSGVSVLLGDYLFARAFSILAETGDNTVVRIMADVVFQMSEGELEHSVDVFEAERGEAHYLEHIDKKTAVFIGECCRLGGLLGGADPRLADALYRYGRSLGMAFQIVDDILDFSGSAQELGKPPGTDLQSGVITLPVLYALRSEEGAELRALLQGRFADGPSLEQAVALVRASGALEESYRVALSHVAEAKRVLAELPPGDARERLRQIAEFVASRRS
ncbi:MAG TPA: polyprenyl synthetase family protein [Bacillota bacterium]